MKSIKKITKSLYSESLINEKKIVKNDKSLSVFWAKSNSKRNAYTVKSIINFIENRNEKRINILNASGIAAGQVDLTIVDYLKKNKKDINWTVVDSPNNSYLENRIFKKKVKELYINIELVDFTKAYSFSKMLNQKFDVILFTEIAEHLDHTSFLKALRQIVSVLDDNGILILTTPNLLSFGFRFKMFFGTTKNMYWGDGQANLNSDLYGHITYYDISRLKRILNDIGITTVKSFTFDYGYRSGFRGVLSDVF